MHCTACLTPGIYNDDKVATGITALCLFLVINETKISEANLRITGCCLVPTTKKHCTLVHIWDKFEILEEEWGGAIDLSINQSVLF